MSYLEKARGVIRNTITATVPLAVWTGLQAGIASAYGEAYDSAENDTRILKEQARFKAAQDRHFFMEYTLQRVARETGSTFMPAMVEENGWRYGQLRAGKVSFTQKCVGSFGEVPPPAKFRERLAASNVYIRQGRFAFMNDAAQASGAELFGVLTHAPESRLFKHPGFRRPSFICLAIPLADYSGWAAKYELSELIASYQPERSQRKVATPKWKSQVKKGGGKSA